MTEHDSDLLKICPLFDLREILRKRWLFLFYGAPEDYYLVVSTLWLAEGVSFWECITNTISSASGRISVLYQGLNISLMLSLVDLIYSILESTAL